MRGNNLAQERVQATGRNTRIHDSSECSRAGHQLSLYQPVFASVREATACARSRSISRSNGGGPHRGYPILNGISHDPNQSRSARYASAQRSNRKHPTAPRQPQSVPEQSEYRSEVELRTLNTCAGGGEYRGIHKTPRVAARNNNLVNRVTRCTSQGHSPRHAQNQPAYSAATTPHVRATRRATTRATFRLSKLQRLTA